ncbi:MAG: FAD-dependent oxidoreductase [Ekhidna sp.]
MKEIEDDVVIIGAGLTGLYLAYLLRDLPCSIRIIEARPHLGGRILTLKKESRAPIEMGATWFGKKHTEINKLLSDLSIDQFEQTLGENAIYEPLSTSPPQLVNLPPSGEDVSFRIKEGTSTLIDRLLKNFGDSCTIDTNEQVVSIEKQTSGTFIYTEKKRYLANHVVSTLPPYLLLNSVKFKPELPANIASLSQNTHTWMGESIKVGLYYDEPFWRASKLSGTIFSNIGPIPEMYDHSDFDNARFALKGFMNGAYYSMNKQERLDLILGQLRKYFGDRADQYIGYEEKVWRNDPLTFLPYQSDLLPHQNNGHPSFLKPLFDGTFHIGGSETASQFPGYMEGALRSALHIAHLLKKRLL